jgi:hypothetical protein
MQLVYVGGATFQTLRPLDSLEIIRFVNRETHMAIYEVEYRKLFHQKHCYVQDAEIGRGTVTVTADDEEYAKIRALALITKYLRSQESYVFTIVTKKS